MWRFGLALLAVGVLVAVGLIALGGRGAPEETATVVGDPAPTTASGPGPTGVPVPMPTITAPTTTEPPTTTTAPPVRLAPEVPIPAEIGPHVWLVTEPDGEPVRWDPCDPIRFVTNSRLAPPGAPEIVAEAMARVTAATGLVFEDAGPSDEAPPPDGARLLRDRARYGDGWSPVLISWTDATEVPELAEYAGLARAFSVWADPGEAIFVSGHVELDAHDASQMLSWGDREYLVALVMHELGHLVGLGHVRETSEVMTDDPGGVVALDWGLGDRFGLATLGRGECDPDI